LFLRKKRYVVNTYGGTGGEGDVLNSVQWLYRDEERSDDVPIATEGSEKKLPQKKFFNLNNVSTVAEERSVSVR